MEDSEKSASKGSDVGVDEGREKSSLRVDESFEEIEEDEGGDGEELHQRRGEVIERDDENVDGPGGA